LAKKYHVLVAGKHYFMSKSEIRMLSNAQMNHAFAPDAVAYKHTNVKKSTGRFSLPVDFENLSAFFSKPHFMRVADAKTQFIPPKS